MRASDNPEHRRKGDAPWWGLPAVVLAVFLAHVTSLSNDFLDYDDRALFVENPLIRSGEASNVWAIFSPDRPNWRPLRDLSHWLDYLVHGQSPFWSHLHNLALLAICVVVMVRLLERLGATPAVALWATALGFVHPMQVETIAWVTGRKDLLACIFGVTALGCLLRMITAERPFRWGVAGFTCTALAIMAKGHLVVMPALFVGLMFVPPRGGLERLKTRRFVLTFVALTVLSACVVPLISRGPVVLRADLLEHGDRFRLSVSDQLQLPGLYVSKYVWPANLSPVYDPLPFGAIHRIYVGLGVGVMLAWVTLLVRWFRVSDKRFAPLFFSLILLMPHLHLVRGTVFMANRYVFLIAPLWSWILVETLVKYVTTSRLLPFILGGLVFAWAGVGMHEHLAWRNSVTLWTRVVERAPDNPYGRQRLGRTFYEAGELERAAPHFMKIADDDPTSEGRNYNAAKVLSELGRYPQARHYLVRCVEHVPDSRQCAQRLLWIDQQLGVEATNSVRR